MKQEFERYRFSALFPGGLLPGRIAAVGVCLVVMLVVNLSGWVHAAPAAAWGMRHSAQGVRPSLTSSVGVTERRDVGFRPVARSDEPLTGNLAPQISATAAFAVDLTSNRFLYQNAADMQISPASTLKMVTALAALRVLDLDEQITVEASDLVDTAVYSNAALLEGDQVLVRDLIAGLLIPSGGDAANALARVAGERLGPAEGQDPIDRFVEEMNQVATNLEMRNSNFVNPDGRDHEDQYTSARDLAFAARELLSRPALAEVVSQTVYEMTITGPNARTYDIYNTNELLGAEDVHGVKTGTTGEAGESLVLVTRRGGNQILTVVMGSEDRYADTQALLDEIDQEVTWVRFGASSRFQGVESAAERFGFIIATPVVIPVRNDRVDSLHAQINLGPRPEGDTALTWGHVVFLQDGEPIYRLPVMSAD